MVNSSLADRASTKSFAAADRDGFISSETMLVSTTIIQIDLPIALAWCAPAVQFDAADATEAVQEDGEQAEGPTEAGVGHAELAREPKSEHQVEAGNKAHGEGLPRAPHQADLTVPCQVPWRRVLALEVLSIAWVVSSTTCRSRSGRRSPPHPRPRHDCDRRSPPRANLSGRHR